MPIRISDPAEAARFAREAALKAGFDTVGIADASLPWPNGAHLRAFVEAGHHGNMGWMERTLERRVHPTAMWPSARSAIVVGMNYGPAIDPMQALAEKDRANISVYARGDDYHDVVKKALKVLAGQIASATGLEVKVFVDTAPLLEKPLAQRAGVGWQGKHTNLVSRDWGSWLFLGAVLTEAALEPDAPEVDHCGSCSACLNACPTSAFPAPYRLDARRCISYLTIEHDGPIPREFRSALGNRIYGCDDCLAVCPWNKFAEQARESRLQARAELVAPSLAELADLDDLSFRALFAKNPVKRIGRNRFVRNVVTALGNSGNITHLAQLSRLSTSDPSPLVRGAAVWALGQLQSSADCATQARDALKTETDPDVRSEWEALIA